jgi:Ca2+-binding RTX toxin-like protein
MRIRALAGLIGTVAALAASGGPVAHAATVSKAPNGLITFEATAGEDNQLSITESGGYIQFQEQAGVTPAPGPGCQAISTTFARCESASVPRIEIHLEDGENDLNTTAPRAIVADGIGATKNLLVGGPFGDQLEGSGGEDLVFGSGGPDVVAGGGGGDDVRGGAGDDQLTGGTGDDILLGAEGADSISGGPDSDLASYRDRVQPVTVTIGSQYLADDGQEGEHDNVGADVENVEGGAADDLLIAKGGDAENTLDGDIGNDRLFGLGGDDLLEGNIGDDTLEGGLGSDRIDGGDGLADVASYASATASVTADLDGLEDDGAVGELDTILTSVESITGGPATDVLSGSDGANVITGGGSGDLIRGGGGSDRLVGKSGRDRIRARDGVADAINCGKGSDSVARDKGVDSVRRCER